MKEQQLNVLYFLILISDVPAQFSLWEGLFIFYLLDPHPPCGPESVICGISYIVFCVLLQMWTEQMASCSDLNLVIIGWLLTFIIETLVEVCECTYWPQVTASWWPGWGSATTVATWSPCPGTAASLSGACQLIWSTPCRSAQSWDGPYRAAPQRPPPLPGYPGCRLKQHSHTPSPPYAAAAHTTTQVGTEGKPCPAPPVPSQVI